jgi:S-DNA-T family DNA segregation ATPase FtsK/SpoIIIE
VARTKAKFRTRTGFLPAGAAAWARRFTVQIAGLGVLALVGGTAAALATYDPLDPSLNRATNHPVSNALGPIGATIADLLLQTLGAAVVLPLLVAALWGLRMLIFSAGVRRLWLRSIGLVVGSVLMAMAMGWFPKPAGWVMLPMTKLGGAVGEKMLDLLARAPEHWGWPVTLTHTSIAAACGLLAMLVAASSTGLTAGEVTKVGENVRKARSALHHAAAKTDGAPATPAPQRLAALFARLRGSWRRPAPVEPRERIEPMLGGGGAGPMAAADPGLAPQDRKAAADFIAPGPKPATPGKRERQARQGAFDFQTRAEGYELPPLGLLTPSPDGKGQRFNEEALAQNARLLEGVLQDFGVNGEIVKVRPGPVVTLYELEPAPGTKTSRVIGLADDIARSMSALSVRIAVIPGRSVIGIELPNTRRDTVHLRELLAAETFEKAGGALNLVLGKDIGGGPVIVDLARMPHLLIAGTTGSGKSVAINTMILSLLYRLKPEDCRMIMIDPKMLELSVYEGIPHLLTPVVTEPGKAVVALKWVVREMENRYRAMSQLGVRNISGYNQRLGEARAKGETLSRTVQTGFDEETGTPVYEQQTLDLAPLPFIVVVVDEMADLMMVAGKEIEAAVQRLAQMARAAGIHLIMATQRPSVDVITGTIKANFPTRISFQVTSKIDSRTILGEQGAEQLLGQGDMLYMASGGRIARVHGPFVSDREVETVVAHLRAQGEPAYLDDVTAEEETPAAAPDLPMGGEDDDLYRQAVAVVLHERKASTSYVQRQLQIGYNRAARLIERMEAEGIVSRANHVGKREILVGGED